MRLIMMGTGPFAVPTFESLLKSDHEIVALVTRPSAQLQTRGKTKAAANPMREVAVSRGVDILEPADVNSLDSRKSLSELKPDLFVVCDYGQILSSETLAIAPVGGINLHGSLLPKYRGAAPVNWAIWKGEQETGVTVLHMTAKLDAGPSLVQSRVAIGPDETADELENRLAKLGVQPVHDAIQMLAAWDGRSPLGKPQDPKLATKARRLRKEDGLANWSQPAPAVYRQFRAVQRWPGFFTHWHGRNRQPLRLILERISVVLLADSAIDVSSKPDSLGSEPDRLDCAPPPPPDSLNSTPNPTPTLKNSDTLVPGTIVGIQPAGLFVATSAGTIVVHRLQAAGGRVMDTSEFIRGNPIQAQDFFA